MFVILLEIITFSKDFRCAKEFFSKVVAGLPIITMVFKASHLLNIIFPIDITPFGIVIEVRDEHSKKAPSVFCSGANVRLVAPNIFSKLLGKFTFFKEVHLAKALRSIVFTPSDIFTVTNELHSEKAFSFIVDILLGMVIEVNPEE
jgi:hypothetical protein